MKSRKSSRRRLSRRRSQRKSASRRVRLHPRLLRMIGGDFLSTTRFDSLPMKPTLARAIRDVFHYETMSEAQQQSIPVALEGKDVFVKAKTGSGKTLGFLIPALERHLESGMKAGEMGILVISPTRELADQTAGEAKKLLSYFESRGAQIVIGGMDMDVEKKRLKNNPCDVLVATPGRLVAHLKDPEIAKRVSKVCCVVLDEADRLLDPGFLPSVKQILGYLPAKEERQTMLWTATVPTGVKEVGALFLRPDYVYIDTVGKEETDSHEHIDQKVALVPPEKVAATLHHFLSAHRDKKTVVFMPSTSSTTFFTAFFRKAGFPDALEIHGDLSQPQRLRSIKSFTDAKTGVLFATDAVARGIDIQDISLVLQVGYTNATQYEHRVGRTGRAGRTGTAIWILGTDEKNLLKSMTRLPIKPYDEPIPDAPAEYHKAVALVEAGGDLLRYATRAFRGTLGTYASAQKSLGWKPGDTVAAVVTRLRAMGMKEVPTMERKTLSKMNMLNAPGLVMTDNKKRPAF